MAEWTFTQQGGNNRPERRQGTPAVDNTPPKIAPPPLPPEQNALTMDSSRYGIRLRVQYPEYLEPHGRDRFLAVMGEAIAKLQRAAEMSDPASLNFVYPPRDQS